MKLAVIQASSPILHEKSTKISRITEDVITLAKNMVDTMYAANGVGLAAPQVGQAIQLIVFDPSPERDQPSALLNPEIVSHSKKTVENIEGCLSCKGFEGYVTRFEKVTVKGLTLNGKTVTIKAEGLLGRILQHEIDHLLGIVITDKARAITPEEQAELDKEDELEL